VPSAGSKNDEGAGQVFRPAGENIRREEAFQFGGERFHHGQRSVNHLKRVPADRAHESELNGHGEEDKNDGQARRGANSVDFAQVPDQRGGPQIGDHAGQASKYCLK
jgi:hypothetical protein